MSLCLGAPGSSQRLQLKVNDATSGPVGTHTGPPPENDLPPPGEEGSGEGTSLCPELHGLAQRQALPAGPLWAPCRRRKLDLQRRRSHPGATPE